MNGFPIWKAKKTLQQVANLSEEEHAACLENAKNSIVNYHFQHTAFYKKLVNYTLPQKWEELPIMTKQDLQQPFQLRLSDEYKSSTVFINKTSGSSGHPFIFAKDKFCHALTWAHIDKMYSQYQVIPSQSYEARFYGIPKDWLGYTKERIKDRLLNRYRFPIFDLSDEQLGKFVEKFKFHKFEYINGYTSSIVQFAKYLQNNTIPINQLCPTLKLCLVTSEMLFESDKKLLEDVFQVPVVNEYGASELGIIAFQNPLNQWLINTQTLWVEIVDDDHKPVPLGTTGHIIITSLYNKAHPLIRYKIGDIGALEMNSTDQKLILKHLVGRTNDFAVLPSGKRIPGLTFYYVTKSVIEDTNLVKEITITQKSTTSFEIHYAAHRALTLAEESNITKAMATYLESGLHILFYHHLVLERSTSGKLKQFTSLL